MTPSADPLFWCTRAWHDTADNAFCPFESFAQLAAEIFFCSSQNSANYVLIGMAWTIHSAPKCFQWNSSEQLSASKYWNRKIEQGLMSLFMLKAIIQATTYNIQRQFAKLTWWFVCVIFVVTTELFWYKTHINKSTCTVHTKTNFPLSGENKFHTKDGSFQFQEVFSAALKYASIDQAKHNINLNNSKLMQTN